MVSVEELPLNIVLRLYKYLSTAALLLDKAANLTIYVPLISRFHIICETRFNTGTTLILGFTVYS